MTNLPYEITVKSGEYRPCIVARKKGLFHRWIEDSKFILKFNVILKPAEEARLRSEFDKLGKVPRGAEVERIPYTLALVEFEDDKGKGHVLKIDPTDIQFLDTGNIMHETAEFHFWDEGMLKGENNG